MDLWPIINTALAQEGATEPASSGVNTFLIGFVDNIKFFIAALLVMALSLILASVVTRVVVRRLTKKADGKLGQEMQILIERSVYAGIVLLGTVIAFDILGIDLMTLLGLFGLGLGFAFKDIFANFIAGVVILTQQKFKIGDLIKVNETFGYITEIDSRTTQVRTIFGTDLVVPNADMITNVVENLTANSYRCLTVDVGVHYSTPLELAVDVAQKAAQRHDKVIAKPEAVAFVKEYAGSSIIINVRFWIESTAYWLPITSGVVQHIKQDFDQNGIVIPYPIRTMALDPYDAQLSQALRYQQETDLAGMNPPKKTATTTVKPKKKTTKTDKKNNHE